VVGTPAEGAVIERAKELLDFARSHGYKRDELIALIAGLR
jgi:GntR family transcriptional regulator